MIINLSEQQSEFLEELLFTKYKELEKNQEHYLYCIKEIDKELNVDGFSANYFKKQLDSNLEYLYNIKSILEVMGQNEY